MTSYIEYIFLENLVINYIIICQVSIFTKIKTKKINFIFGIVILSFYTTLSYFLDAKILSSTFIKIFVINFSIYIIYIPKEIKMFFKIFVYYFLISFLLVGLVIALSLIFNIDISNIILKVLVYIISGSLLYLFNKYMWKMWKSNIKKDDLMYQLKIKDVIVNSFIDTGNTVYDYGNNLDVIFIENKYFDPFFYNRVLSDNINLSINTISGNEKLKGYIINNVKVFKNKQEIFEFKKVVFVFINKKLSNNEYNALIGYNTYLDKLKGVSLC